MVERRGAFRGGVDRSEGVQVLVRDRSDGANMAATNKGLREQVRSARNLARKKDLATRVGLQSCVLSPPPPTHTFLILLTPYLAFSSLFFFFFVELEHARCDEAYAAEPGGNLPPGHD